MRYNIVVTTREGSQYKLRVDGLRRPARFENWNDANEVCNILNEHLTGIHGVSIWPEPEMTLPFEPNRP